MTTPKKRTNTERHRFRAFGILIIGENDRSCEIVENVNLQIETNQMCCAVADINGLGETENPAQALFAICKVGLSGSHVLFTQAGRSRTYGIALRDYIHANGLGTVVTSAMAVNPKTRNPVVAFLWVPNKGALAKWYTRATNACDFVDEERDSADDGD